MRNDRQQNPSGIRTGRRRLVLAGGALALTGCAAARPGPDAQDRTEVPAPTLRAGDQWTYRRTDTYTHLDVGNVTREVVGGDAKGLRVVTRTADGRTLDEATYASAGVVVAGNLSEDSPIGGTIEPGYERYAFPLVAGKNWRQAIKRTDANGYHEGMTVRTSVEGWETLQALGRDLRVVVIRREFNLGPKNAFNGPLFRAEREWYSPELRAAVRLDLNEWYQESRTNVFTQLPGARYRYELVTFRPG